MRMRLLLWNNHQHHQRSEFAVDVHQKLNQLVLMEGALRNVASNRALDVIAQRVSEWDKINLMTIKSLII